MGAIRRTGGGRAGDLVEVGELDVVAVEDVDVVEAEACEALVDAAGDAGGAEVEPFPVAPALGGDHEPVPRHARGAEAVPEHRLRHRAAVVPAICDKGGRGGRTLRSAESRGRRRWWYVRGGVEEVDAEVEGAADGGAGDVAGDVAEDMAEREAPKPTGLTRRPWRRARGAPCRSPLRTGRLGRCG